MNTETETVECPACDWRGHPVSAYQTKAGPFCPNCIDEGGHIRCVPANTTPPPLSAMVEDGALYCPDCWFQDEIRVTLTPDFREEKKALAKAFWKSCEPTGIEAMVCADPLSDAMAALLDHPSMFPEARALVEMAIRVQCGETVYLRAELERRAKSMSETPSHYQSASGVTPWDLQKALKSSGSPFVDARRCDAIKYCFRLKDDVLADLRKAKHCLEAAIEELERNPSPKQPECCQPHGIEVPPYEDPWGIFNGWEIFRVSGQWRAKAEGMDTLDAGSLDVILNEINRANAKQEANP